MKITKKVIYALEIASMLAEKDNSTKLSSRDLAERIGVSMAFIQNICQCMRKKGLVSAFNGSSGGYVLCKPASQITVRDVFEAVDEDCLLMEKGTDNKRVRQLFTDTQNKLDKTLDLPISKI